MRSVGIPLLAMAVCLSGIGAGLRLIDKYYVITPRTAEPPPVHKCLTREEVESIIDAALKRHNLILLPPQPVPPASFRVNREVRIYTK